MMPFMVNLKNPTLIYSQQMVIGGDSGESNATNQILRVVRSSPHVRPGRGSCA